MKSKFTTYLLIAAVVVIWGLIVKRIFFSDDKEPAIQVRTTSVAIDDKETQTLLLDYRDPFGMREPAPKSAPKQSAKPLPQEPQLEPFNIHFMGTINHDKRTFYIVELGGSQYTITIGSELDGFRLTAVSGGKLHFVKNKQSYYLAL